jgi:hypothetical protein
LCDLRPLISAIKPTPQESFSRAGSNSPKAFGSKPCGSKPCALIVTLALPSRGLSPVRGVDTHVHCRAPLSVLLNRRRRRKMRVERPRASLYFLEATFAPPGGPSPPGGLRLLVRRTPARPRPRRLASACLCPSRSYPGRAKIRRTARAQATQNRTAILSYADHGRSRAIAQERTSSPFSPSAK